MVQRMRGSPHPLRGQRAQHPAVAPAPDKGRPAQPWVPPPVPEQTPPALRKPPPTIASHAAGWPRELSQNAGCHSPGCPLCCAVSAAGCACAARCAASRQVSMSRQPPPQPLEGRCWRPWPTVKFAGQRHALWGGPASPVRAPRLRNPKPPLQLPPESHKDVSERGWVALQLA